MTNKTICIVGLGLLGGSYAMGLTRAGNTVYGIDVREESIQFAKTHGYIADGAIADYDKFLQKADLIVLGLYPRILVNWVEQHKHLLKSGAVITDVCGVKCGIVEAVQNMLPSTIEFYSGHPMRGKEVLGVENADCAIFRDANFILVPSQKNTAYGEKIIRDMAVTLGFVKFTTLSPVQHDKMVGYVSQLTHAIAVSLMTANDNTHLVDYTGDSFRDLTRIAKINETLWSELFLWNKDNLIEEIDTFCASLQNLRQTLVDNDEQALKDLFILSTQRRKRFDK